jgi:hypothetical protein
MKVFFMDDAARDEFLTKKRQRWLTLLDPSQLDRFVMRVLKEKFLIALVAAEKDSSFEPLQDILGAFDLMMLDEKSLSGQYLKSVWGIPYFVFVDDQEAAAMKKLQLQKSYRQQREEFARAVTAVYQARLLRWSLLHPFTKAEIKQIGSICNTTKQNESFYNTKVFQLYQKLLAHSGVPMELAELYGAEVFLEKIVKIFDQFPHQESEWSSLPDHAQYTLLLEDAVEFCSRHLAECDAKPEVLLSVLIKIMIHRMAEFQEKK